MEPGSFDPRTLPRSFYEARIRELSEHHRELTKAANDVNDEIKWWIAGRDRFAPDEDQPDQAKLEGLDDNQNGDAGIAPENLRAAISFVLRQDGPMKPGGVIDALRERGWAPAAKSGPQMIRNRMLSMLDIGELGRDADGRYQSASQSED